MTTDHATDLKAAFAERKAKEKASEAEVPERIRKHAPTPVLRPEGSWKARADAIDRSVREAQDAARAKNEWAARLGAKARRSTGKGLKRNG